MFTIDDIIAMDRPLIMYDGRVDRATNVSETVSLASKFPPIYECHIKGGILSAVPGGQRGCVAHAFCNMIGPDVYSYVHHTDETQIGIVEPLDLQTCVEALASAEKNHHKDDAERAAWEKVAFGPLGPIRDLIVAAMCREI